jgi:hypothetical protein
LIIARFPALRVGGLFESARGGGTDSPATCCPSIIDHPFPAISMTESRSLTPNPAVSLCATNALRSIKLFSNFVKSLDRALIR